LNDRSHKSYYFSADGNSPLFSVIPIHPAFQ